MKPIIPPVDERQGVIDELQAWFLAQAEAEGMVYTRAIRQLVNRMYRDRDYQAKRLAEGKRTAFDWAMDRDQKALAWAIQSLVRFVPPVEKAQPEPARPAKPKRTAPRRRLSPAERAEAAESTGRRGRGPSWNGQPKRDWNGPDLPDLTYPLQFPSQLEMRPGAGAQ